MRHPTRRRLLAAGLAAPLVLGRATAAATFPSRPLRIVVPFTPGASTDQIARLLAQRLGETWKRTVLVENRPGGATQIGTDVVAKAPPDGHTMLLAGFAFGVNPSLVPKPPYDALRDFTPVVLCAATPNLLVVGADQPIRTVAELLAVSRSSPEGLAFASAGVATSNHLCIELLKAKTGANLLHVPYKGSAPAVLDVIADEQFLADVRAKGERLRSRIEQFLGNYPELFESVRGRGLFIGLKMKVEPRGFVAHMRDNHGVLTVSAGENVVRIVPPLVIDDGHIDEFMDKLSAAAASFQSAQAA